eukprot:1837386-Amphidinium_carterae.1
MQRKAAAEIEPHDVAALQLQKSGVQSGRDFLPCPSFKASLRLGKPSRGCCSSGRQSIANDLHACDATCDKSCVWVPLLLRAQPTGG